VVFSSKTAIATSDFSGSRGGTQLESFVEIEVWSGRHRANGSCLALGRDVKILRPDTRTTSEELSIREMQGRSDTSMRIFFLAVVQMATRSRLVVERQGIRKE